MESGQMVAEGAEGSRALLGPGLLLLAIDTCGPTGSVALGRLANGEPGSRAAKVFEILGQIELEGRSYSSTLITAVGDLLKKAGAGLKDLGAIVAVYGPGSFTGVRVGLSAVKGLAEPSQIPVVVVSRLEALAAKADVETAALDAHRGEIFLRIRTRTTESRAAELPAAEPSSVGLRETLAGAAELKSIDPAPAQVAVCDDEAAALVGSAWPSAQLVRVSAPNAADALRLAADRVGAGSFVDLALLDGNYLRRSDAEIFGEATEAQRK
jgi:tRNA threonylcarbamoyladenosine biosynthesis protein TsaB